MKITAILGSSRRNGNSELLVQRILKEVESDPIHLLDYHIKPVEDKRHTQEGFTFVADDYEKIISRVLQNDILIFAAPLYWFGMPGQMKIFFDRWSQYLRDERFDFKHEMSKKQAYVVITAGDDPKTKALPLIQQFKYIFDYVGMNFVDYIIGSGNKPGEVSQDESALHKAYLWDKKFRQ
jgi:multimeric flavodoxin WrbA